MNSIVRSTAFAVVLCSVGCVPKAHPEVPSYDPSMPIDRTHGWRQDGELVNGKEVEKGLLLEPEAAPYMRRAKTLSTVSLVFAGAGGACIGWPLGQALAHNPDPLWELAAVGGGIVVLSLALIPVIVGNANHAIDAHNELVGPPQVSFANGNLRLEANAQGLALKF
jgi:hypothetical protein